ncbi:MAG: hypothetical protein KKD44_04305 [Proteobacteria bacterium]|nr:hypothetical protein [Pseudomonadota bacterium]
MARYPDIHHLKLEKCCIDTINEINKRLKLGNVLSVGVGAGAWANIFGPSPSTLNTIVSVAQINKSIRVYMVVALFVACFVNNAMSKELDVFLVVENKKPEEVKIFLDNFSDIRFD